MREILDTFLNNRADGLAVRLGGAEHWNFYDWSEYSDGMLGKTQEAEADAAINCLLITALEEVKEICEIAEQPFPYEGIADPLRTAAKERFFVPEAGLVTMRATTEEYTELANSLAVLAGLFTEDEAKAVCEKIADGAVVPCSLSMRIFKYEALLKTDKTRFYPLILEEIRRDYKTMLDAGYDCVWETTKGWPAFDNAGSLCHGWSAVPVLYLPQMQE